MNTVKHSSKASSTSPVKSLSMRVELTPSLVKVLLTAPGRESRPSSTMGSRLLFGMRRRARGRYLAEPGQAEAWGLETRGFRLHHSPISCPPWRAGDWTRAYRGAPRRGVGWTLFHAAVFRGRAARGHRAMRYFFLPARLKYSTCCRRLLACARDLYGPPRFLPVCDTTLYPPGTLRIIP